MAQPRKLSLNDKALGTVIAKKRFVNGTTTKKSVRRHWGQ